MSGTWLPPHPVAAAAGELGSSTGAPGVGLYRVPVKLLSTGFREGFVQEFLSGFLQRFLQGFHHKDGKDFS